MKRYFTKSIPISLYIHIPWCIRKCPYCDFNSHQVRDDLPQELYVNAILSDLDGSLGYMNKREIISIFFGGGTPSLFSAKGIGQILNHVAKNLTLSEQIEITLEANPGTVDQKQFYDYRQCGINRLSLGIQSLQNDKLQTLGRIHNSQNALDAIKAAKKAGFSNFNLDMMYGLPGQSVQEALADVEKALSCHPRHFSWYQLTIEPNTFFYHHPPPLPNDDFLWEMQQSGQALLKAQGYEQYEVSAYAKDQQTCRHNLNYWQFGDYLGVGAGAHSKITNIENGQVYRFAQPKHPRDYMQKKMLPEKKILTEKDILFEFMLNALRLSNGIPLSLFSARTGLPLDSISTIIQKAKDKGLLLDNAQLLKPTTLGQRFLNDLIAMFLE